MSTSETITRTDLTNVLNAVLPSGANTLNYDSDITTLFDTPWTCPESGIMIMAIGSMTGGGRHIAMQEIIQTVARLLG